MIVLAALEGHDIKHLPLVYHLSRWLWRILSWVMGMERMRLEYNGRVPGGTAGSVGVELGGISPCVRESSAGESGWKIGTWKHRERSGEFIYETFDAQKWGSSIGAESS